MDKALEYWQSAPATIDGVLGGMEHVHEIDIQESKAFLESMPFLGRERALDCAAGIGRISKHLLCPIFSLTDLLEPFEHMLNRAKAELPPDSVGEFLQMPMQQAVLRHTYDVIAIQWAAAYLTDEELVTFLTRIKTALKSRGVIFLKDNVSSRDNRNLDADDYSQARSDRQYKNLFTNAGLECVKERYQQTWPRDLFQAKMYALR